MEPYVVVRRWPVACAAVALALTCAACGAKPDKVGITLDATDRPIVQIAGCTGRDTTSKITLYREGSIRTRRDDDEILWQVKSDGASHIPKQFVVGETPDGFTEVTPMAEPLDGQEGSLSLNVLLLGTVNFDADQLASETVIYWDHEAAADIRDFEAAVCD